MAFNFFSLPPTIQQVLLSDEYLRFLGVLKGDFELTREQEDLLAQLLYDLFSKSVTPAELEKNIQSRFGLDVQRTRTFTKEILLNIVIPFRYYFGDYSQLYRSFGGDPEADIMESFVALAILKMFNASIENVVNELGSINWEKEGEAMRELFVGQFVEVLYGPDAEWKERLNSTIITLLRQFDGYNEKLLGALYENEQHIGSTSIVLGDGSTQQPTVANWIKDYLGFSGGVVSSIKIAQYMTDSSNVKKMAEVDRDVVRKLLETFATLKNFPVSLDKAPEEHWMVIPYHIAELEAKTARDLPKVPGVVGGVEMTTAQPMQAIAQKEPLSVAQSSVPVDYDGAITRIMEVVALKVSDEVIARIKPILSSRVRNIRNSIDTGERLKAALTDGGAGLSVEDADKLLKEANIAAQAIGAGKIQEYLPVKIEDQEKVQEKIEETGSVPAQAGIKSGMTPIDSGIAAVEVTPAETGSRIESGMTESPMSFSTEEVPTMTIKEVNGVPTLVEKKNGNGKKKDVPAVVSVVGAPKVPEPAPALIVQPPPLPAASKEPDNATGSLPVVEMMPAVTIPDKSAAVPTPASPVPPAIEQTPPQPPAPPNFPPHLADAKPIPVTVRATAAVGTPKTKVADIKAPPRLVGVVDEIRALTIKDFRRLSQDPKEAAKRIAQKIQALEKESLTKKAEAIKAWKESDVYALYLEIGQINLGVDMNKLIEERKAAGKEYLTSEEFDALLDMNENLRF
ncbi:MAG: hypothetical protein Q8P56_00460 [Candidatus Uhrbacteria bacterium]|nr:hypothetical protein [Candidatus Uhrbacteria bacterium]